jgi:hypothetical protein
VRTVRTECLGRVMVLGPATSSASWQPTSSITTGSVRIEDSTCTPRRADRKPLSPLPKEIARRVLLGGLFTSAAERPPEPPA